MADVIINAGNGVQYYAAYNNDFAYRFVRGSDIWACLLHYPNDFFGQDEQPAMFLSTNGGASWTLQNGGGAPIANKVGPISVTYDSRFNFLNAASETSISLIYAEPALTPVYDWHTVDFDLDTHTYGSPYGAFTVDRPATSHAFSSRPDGTLVTFYTRLNSGSEPIGVFYR